MKNISFVLMVLIVFICGCGDTSDSGDNDSKDYKVVLHNYTEGLIGDVTINDSELYFIDRDGSKSYTFNKRPTTITYSVCMYPISSGIEGLILQDTYLTQDGYDGVNIYLIIPQEYISIWIMNDTDEIISAVGIFDENDEGDWYYPEIYPGTNEWIGIFEKSKCAEMFVQAEYSCDDIDVVPEQNSYGSYYFDCTYN